MRNKFKSENLMKLTFQELLIVGELCNNRINYHGLQNQGNDVLLYIDFKEYVQFITTEKLKKLIFENLLPEE